MITRRNEIIFSIALTMLSLLISQQNEFSGGFQEKIEKKMKKSILSLLINLQYKCVQ